jgi:hypothetical protein
MGDLYYPTASLKGGILLKLSFFFRAWADVCDIASFRNPVFCTGVPGVQA